MGRGLGHRNSTTTIVDFWTWAQTHSASQITADYNALNTNITLWHALGPEYRLSHSDQTAELARDCVNVLAQLQMQETPLDRVDRLQAYATVLGLSIAMEAERTELEILYSAWDTTGRASAPADWWNGLSDEQREVHTAAIASTKRARISTLLLASDNSGFARQMTGMDTGTLLGGDSIHNDFELARDRLFSELEYDPYNGNWVYYVGRGVEPNCADRSACKAYHITQGSTSSTEGPRFYVEFDGGSGPFYPNAETAYNEHRALVLKDMIVRNYGPVRVLADAWWEIWGLGQRERLGLDTELETYIDQADAQRSSSLSILLNALSYDATDADKYFLYGFALSQGLSATETLVNVARDNPDFLATPVDLFGVSWTKFPFAAHRNAIRAWPASSEVLALPYRGIPTSKFVVLNGFGQ